MLVWGEPMRIQRIAILCAALAGCTGADSHAYLPAFMRDREPEPAVSEKPPAVAQIVGPQLEKFFVRGPLP